MYIYHIAHAREEKTIEKTRVDKSVLTLRVGITNQFSFLFRLLILYLIIDEFMKERSSGISRVSPTNIITNINENTAVLISEDE